MKDKIEEAINKLIETNDISPRDFEHTLNRAEHIISQCKAIKEESFDTKADAQKYIGKIMDCIDEIDDVYGELKDVEESDSPAHAQRAWTMLHDINYQRQRIRQVKRDIFLNWKD